MCDIVYNDQKPLHHPIHIIHYYQLRTRRKNIEKVKMKMEPKKTYMILHILTLAVIRTTGLSHYVEKLDELPFTTTKYFHFFSFKKNPTEDRYSIKWRDIPRVRYTLFCFQDTRISKNFLKANSTLYSWYVILFSSLKVYNYNTSCWTNLLWNEINFTNSCHFHYNISIKIPTID